MATSTLQVKLEHPEAVPSWNLVKRIGFRFIFLYFTLYNFPFPIGWIPGTDGIYQAYSGLLHRFVPWVGRDILRLSYPITVFTNGSGDTTYDYVLVLCFLVLAVIGTSLWSVLDRRRANYEKLHAGFRLGIRMLLAGTMILFGSVKVFQVQFPVLTPSRLLQTYGDSSPMGLLWTFMGASPGYSAFTGVVEMLGGVLLVFTRLTTLGALVSAAAMANVFALNLTYDVPVKLYSFHVLLMSVILIAPELRRLGNVLVFNRPATSATYPPLLTRQVAQQALTIAQLAFAGYIFCNALYQAYKVDGRLASKPPHYGVWSVDDFKTNGPSPLPALADSTRWRRLIFDDFETVAVQPMEGEPERLRLEQADKTITLRKADQGWIARLHLEEPFPETMILTGQVNNQDVIIRLHNIHPHFLLTTRRFHWINESPFNR